MVRSERALGHRGASVLIIAREVDEAADGALPLFLLARRDRHLSAAGGVLKRSLRRRPSRESPPKQERRRHPSGPYHPQPVSAGTWRSGNR